MPRRLLLWSDSLQANTGFSRPARQLVDGLKDWQVTQVAINHSSDQAERLPKRIEIVDAQYGSSVYGEPQAFKLLLEGDYDLLAIIQDTFIASRWTEELRGIKAYRRQSGMKPTKVLYHFPIDGPTSGGLEMLDVADVNVCCTRWGVDLISRWLAMSTERSMTVLPHGVDTTTFKPISKARRQAARREIFGIGLDEVFLVGWVGTNLIRKDPLQAIQTLMRFRELYGAPRSVLYLHTDIEGQSNIFGLLHHLRLMPGVDVIVKGDTWKELPDSAMNDYYGSFDALLFTSRREGFGLPMIESMAAGLPVVAPNYGPFAEVLGDLGDLHDPAFFVDNKDDHRGPGYMTDPARAAEALLRVAVRRGTKAQKVRSDALRRLALEYDHLRIAQRWRRGIENGVWK